MEMYIYGASREGRLLKQKLKKEYGIAINGFLDTYKVADDIVSLNDVPRDAIIIISPQFQQTAIDIYNKLKSLGRKNIYWYHNAKDNHINKYDFLNECCTPCDNWGNLIMPHIEFHIVDNCNLNCRGCSHFSPLYTETKESVDNKIMNIDKLLKKFSNIARLDILGGEPLLSTNLCEYVARLRKKLPDSYLRIFTNGILVPNLTDGELNSIRDNNVGVFISEYKPTHQMIEKIESKLIKYGIRYEVTGYQAREKFNIPISINEKSNLPWQCISVGCYALGDGKLAKCPTLLYIGKFNEFFKQKLPIDGLIDLDTNMSGEKILRKLKEEVPLCKYCVKCPVDWSICRKPYRMTDFVTTK